MFTQPRPREGLLSLKVTEEITKKEKKKTSRCLHKTVRLPYVL